MPELSYNALIEISAKPHLVVGLVTHTRPGQAQRLMSALVRGVGVAGDYAFSRETVAGGVEVKCLFLRKPDADRLARAVLAQPVGRYPGWASQRWFLLDEDAQGKIETALREADEWPLVSDRRRVAKKPPAKPGRG